jgi:acyl-CoA thioester hydrolase
MSETPGEPIEVWRGGVNAWECDEMGHLNVRHHLARSMQGLAGTAAALGMPHAFAPFAAATLVVRKQHVRFLREARAGDLLHMTARVTEIEESEAEILLTLIHSRTGLTSATFLTRVAHAAARDGRAFPWPERARVAAERLKAPVTAEAAPRSLVEPWGPDRPNLEDAVARGLRATGRSVVTPEDCDVFGRFRTEQFMGRISDAIGHLVEPVRAALQAAAPDRRIGGAALEYRLIYFDQPRAGDLVEVRAGMTRIEPKLMRMSHWLLDPHTGAAWAAAENISVNFDLDRRKTMSLSDDLLAAAQAHLVAP